MSNRRTPAVQATGAGRFRLGILVSASLLTLLGGAALAETPKDALKSGFTNPPNSARPRVWWHWMNGNITKEGVQKDLEWMSRVGLGMDDAVWSPTTFSKNRDRLLDGDIAAAFFDAVVEQATLARLLSDEHFTVDGTLLEAWASHKSFRPRDEEPPSTGGGNPTVNFHGQRRSNTTHHSTTDPDARLYKKARGREARLGYLGHVLMEHRSGLIVRATVTLAQTTVIAKGMPTVEMRATATLVREDAAEIALEAAPRLAAEAITAHIDHAAHARARHQKLVAGAHAPELIADARAAAHLDRKQPGVDKVDFELWSLAVSAVNGCGMCLTAHEHELRKGGLGAEQVQAAVRIAAVVHAVAAALDGEAALSSNLAAAAE